MKGLAALKPAKEDKLPINPAPVGAPPSKGVMAMPGQWQLEAFCEQARETHCNASLQEIDIKLQSQPMLYAPLRGSGGDHIWLIFLRGI